MDRKSTIINNYMHEHSLVLRLQTGHSPEPRSPNHNPPAHFHTVNTKVNLLPDLPTGTYN